MEIEKRKYTRYTANEGTFAALRSNFEKVGRVLDISVKGLAFSYLDGTGKSTDTESLEVDIFLTQNGCHLYRIPCKIVYDIPHLYEKSFYHAKSKRCGLSFGRLSSEQEKDLKRFIMHNSSGTVKSL